MTNAENIINAIGRKHLASILGVGVSAISNAAKGGSFPANWYRIIRSECERLDIELDEGLFAFRKAQNDADAA